LVYTGPALDTILWPHGLRFIVFDLIDFTGTDVHAVSAALARLSVYNRIHLQVYVIGSLGH